MSQSSTGGFFRNCLIMGGILFIIFIICSVIGGIVLVSAVGSIAANGMNLTKDASSDIETKYISGNADAKNYIAVIDVKGVISSGTDSLDDGANSENIIKLIRAAKEDSEIKAIIINLDTPGGEVTAADEIYHELKLCGKPVVAMMNAMAASGGYYIAAAADKIVANKFTLTGSIGVIISSYDVSGLLDWAKVKPEFYTSGKMKTMLNPTKPTTKEESEVIQTLVMNTYQVFAEIVSKSRNIPIEKITHGEIGDGRVFDGEQALKLGLVDKLGYFSAAEETAMELAGLNYNNCCFLRIKNKNMLSDFFRQIGVQAAPASLNGVLSKSNVFILKAGRPYFLSTGF